MPHVQVEEYGPGANLMGDVDPLGQVNSGYSMDQGEQSRFVNPLQ